MTDDPLEKNRVALEPIQLKVLGGTFTVREVFANPQDDLEEVVRMIRATPSDRWFVMLAEETQENAMDVLALIDDEFEFQSIAAGTMENE